MSRLLRGAAAAALGAMLLSCSDASPVAAPADPAASRSLLGQTLGLLPSLLQCSPVPFDSVQQVVGPSGATINVGPHRLVIPPGALDSNTTVTAVVSPDSLNLIRFGPHGLQFGAPATLTMSYANCPIGGLLSPLFIVYTNDAHSVLEVELTTKHLLTETLTAHISHFSGYAVAY